MQEGWLFLRNQHIMATFWFCIRTEPIFSNGPLHGSKQMVITWSASDETIGKETLSIKVFLEFNWIIFKLMDDHCHIGRYIKTISPFSIKTKTVIFWQNETKIYMCHLIRFFNIRLSRNRQIRKCEIWVVLKESAH